jgi:hypothetical protein
MPEQRRSDLSRPDRTILLAYGGRAVLHWVGIRCVFGVLLAFNSFPPFARSLNISLTIVAWSAFLAFADLWRRRELVLLGNMGVDYRVIVFQFGVVAACGEVAFALFR